LDVDSDQRVLAHLFGVDGCYENLFERYRETAYGRPTCLVTMDVVLYGAQNQLDVLRESQNCVIKALRFLESLCSS